MVKARSGHFMNELTDFKEKYKNLVDDDMAKMDEEE